MPLSTFCVAILLLLPHNFWRGFSLTELKSRQKNYGTEVAYLARAVPSVYKIYQTKSDSLWCICFPLFQQQITHHVRVYVYIIKRMNYMCVCVCSKLTDGGA
jgi:hypothetical protein